MRSRNIAIVGVAILVIATVFIIISAKSPRERVANILLRRAGVGMGDYDFEDSTLREILKRAEFFDLPVTQIPGELGKCYQNSTEYVKRNPDFYLCIGFALSLNGEWWFTLGCCHQIKRRSERLLDTKPCIGVQ